MWIAEGRRLRSRCKSARTGERDFGSATTCRQGMKYEVNDDEGVWMVQKRSQNPNREAVRAKLAVDGERERGGLEEGGG